DLVRVSSNVRQTIISSAAAACSIMWSLAKVCCPTSEVLRREGGSSSEQRLPLASSDKRFAMIIRDYQPGDAAALRRWIVVLQEAERAIDPFLLPGETMADRYCARIHERCREAAGRVYVAEEESALVGFVTVLAREPFMELDDPPGHYALITDLVVLESH